MDRSIELQSLVETLLNNTNVSIEKIETEVRSKGFNFKIQGGDEQHGTYAIFQNYHKFSVAITKCHCGHIHYLEDMCIKCHPDWAMTFLKNGNIKVNSEFVKELSNKYDDDLPW